MKLTADQANALKTITRTAWEGRCGRTTDIRAAKGLERKGLIRILSIEPGAVRDGRGTGGNRTGSQAAFCEIIGN